MEQSASPVTTSDSSIPTPNTSVESSEESTSSRMTKVAEETDLPAPFEDVNVNESQTQETRDKLARLNFLLKASGIYSKIIADNIERERASREAALKKHSEQIHRQENPANVLLDSKPGPETSTRRSKRGDQKLVAEPSVVKSLSTRSRNTRKVSSHKDTTDAEQVVELLKNVHAESDAEPSKNPTTAEGPTLGQPALITGATMRPYQLAGMHWLATLYENGLNGILADEMGLGKTLQTIAFLCYLRERGVWGPFLVVCPLSTLANWVNEFERFCPTFPVVLYHGTRAEREELRANRMAPPSDEPKAWCGKPFRRTKGRPSVSKRNTRWTSQNTKHTFPVVVTSYEIVMNDRAFLSQYAWSYIVVDESHRLKNLECKLVQELKSYKSANRLLLTGTPLHNNLKELWSLLNFILPEIFDDYSSFEQWFDLSSVTAASDSAAALSSAQAQHIVTNLHAILKPFLLRRMKAEVETSLPKKKEYLLSAPLTAQQKELYDAVINKNLRTLLVHQKSAATMKAFSPLETHPIIPSQPQKRLRTNSDVSELSEDGSDPKKIRAYASSEDEGPLSVLTKIKKRVIAPRRSAIDRKATGYAEKSDSQFFKEVEEGCCDEIDYTFDDSVPKPEKIDQRSYQERADQLAIKNVNQMKLQNVVMQLRKVCNHPWLFDWPIDPQTGEYSIGQGLISASGKMLLLEKLLKGLFYRGHKVLVFSQFTSMLDIIYDWATEFKGWPVCRIDGSTKQDDRRLQMKEFNEGQGVDACNLFLLSTRAGGVGINLVAADTVILFDSDWNPQQDLQAQDRAHRIGQTKPVLVFRLVSGNTIESKMLQKAGEKRKLETLVIGNGFDLTQKQDHDEHDESESEDDIQNILLGKTSHRKKQKSMKELAEALLKADGQKIALAEQGDEIISDEQLESLLDRSDEAMNRPLGWNTKHSSSKMMGAEVYHTKATE